MSYTGIWDGFDDYNTTGERWDTVSGTPQYSSAYVRFGAAPNCVAQGCRLSASMKTKNYTANVSNPIASFAVLFESLPGATGGSSQGFLTFSDSGSQQVTLAVNSSGGLEVWRGNGFALGTKIASSAPGIIGPNGYYFIDFICTISSSSGTVSVYVSTPAGGSAVISASGLNTQWTADSFVNQVSIGFVNGGTAVTAIRYDDFHAHDGGGSAPNAVLGEGTRIYTKMPNGAGYATTFTPNGASANWQCVDDVPPDGDTTYVATSSIPSTEGYAVGAAGFTGTVNGVVRLSYLRKDDAGSHTFENGVRSSTTNGLSAAIAVNSTYTWWQSFFGTDPNTSAAWTATGADAAAPVISAVT